MARALVTGANGFLGRYVCRELRRQGESVVCLSRSAHSQQGETVVIPEKPSADDLLKIIERTQASMIYHLAGTSQMSDVPALYQANVFFAEALLTAAANSLVRPGILLIGSAAEYGTPVSSDMTCREGDVCRPVSSYGISKLAQTYHGLAAARGGLDVTIARLFNPIGVGSPACTALGSFVGQIAAIKGHAGTLKTGSLDAVRDFIEVAEAARVIVELPRLKAAHGDVVNVCSGVGTKLENIVSSLMKVSGAEVMLLKEDFRRGTSDLNMVVGSNARLRELGLEVALPDFEAIMREMLAAERSNSQSVLK
ncbi:GDP-mannose 4,6-dehydratase [Rhizobium viscosum]|uniref:GDP-4-dehydro-6-deoxy-D-mannose reductase n=1 Tax=Rhizobium viscosum TaxID=1673 RepID=A0ABR9IZD1_RHIVS|nr:NAD-dependent epimerase/dehydratase family protein [Rhizobium viscosum]MBE1508577.1 GDP-4-dehydro-6-deoxy-D-mannose reductase [Rhizobium viscosum]